MTDSTEALDIDAVDETIPANEVVQYWCSHEKI